MKSYRYLIVLISIFTLSACGHMGTASKDVDVVSTQDNGSSTPVMTAPPIQNTKSNYGVLPNFDYQVTNASNGNVTVYSLDGAPPAITPRIEANMSPSPVVAQPIGQFYASSNPQSYSRSSRGSSVADEQIFFKNGSSRLGRIDKQKISRFADAAKFAPVNRVTVEGYASRPTQRGTNTVEGHILNLKESMNRSFAVSKSLIQNGLPAEKIKTVSYGSTKATGNHAQDRRVNMIMGER